MQKSELLEGVCRVARGAGALIREIRRPQVFSKEGHANFVTSADIASQKYILEQLAPMLPKAHFFAEEQEDHRLMPGDNWIIDPIDGTTNFMRGYRHSAVSIGLIREGEAMLGVVYNPFSEELFCTLKGQGATLNGQTIHAAATEPQKALIALGTTPYDRSKARQTLQLLEELFLSCGDIRRSGSAALDLCDIAAGRCDGFFEVCLSPWDYAAASVILTEAGGQIGSVSPHVYGYERAIPIIAGCGETFELVRKAAEKNIV